LSYAVPIIERIHQSPRTGGRHSPSVSKA